jgi:hypothetical protein
VARVDLEQAKIDFVLADAPPPIASARNGNGKKKRARAT